MYRGGSWYLASAAGVFSAGGYYPRSYYGTGIGFRPAFVRLSEICQSDNPENEDTEETEPSGKKYETCANCGAELGDEYYTVRDNFLQVKYFEEPDGHDNAFCSQECACEALMIEAVPNRKEDDDE